MRTLFGLVGALCRLVETFMLILDYFNSFGLSSFISLYVFWQAPIMKEYPAKLSLVTLQCFFSVIQATVGAIAMERNLSSWKLGWDINLLSVAYCVCNSFHNTAIIRYSCSAQYLL